MANNDDERKAKRALGEVVARAGEGPLGQLYEWYREDNERLFGGRLAPDPWINRSRLGGERRGDYTPKDELGMQSRIRLSSRVMREPLQTRRWALRHEMVHAACYELYPDDKPGSYKGHGDRFAEICNRLGVALGIPKVGRSGNKEGLPDAATWPWVTGSPIADTISSDTVGDPTTSVPDGLPVDDDDGNSGSEDTSAGLAEGTPMPFEEKVLTVVSRWSADRLTLFIRQLTKLRDTKEDDASDAEDEAAE